MSDCRPKILVESHNYNVAQCPHCSRVGLYYHNILIGFELKEFCSFSKSVLRIDFDMNCLLFPDEEEHVVLNTCHRDIQLSFKRREFEEFSSMLNQALLIIQAEQFVKIRKNG